MNERREVFCDANCNECPFIVHDNSKMITHILNKIMDKHPDVYTIIEEHCPNLTCCYDCRIDDFGHHHNCELIKECKDCGRLAGHVAKTEKQKPITAKEIIKKYLQDNGYDGLYYPEECGCRVGNLMPCIACGGVVDDCIPGYLQQIDENDLTIKQSEDAERNFTIGGKKLEEF